MAKAAPQMGSRPCRCCSALALLGMSQMRLPPAKHTNCHQHTASASTTKHSSCLTANNLNRSVGPALASYHIRASPQTRWRTRRPVVCRSMWMPAAGKFPAGACTRKWSGRDRTPATLAVQRGLKSRPRGHASYFERFGSLQCFGLRCASISMRRMPFLSWKFSRSTAAGRRSSTQRMSGCAKSICDCSMSAASTAVAGGTKKCNSASGQHLRQAAHKKHGWCLLQAPAQTRASGASFLIATCSLAKALFVDFGLKGLN